MGIGPFAGWQGFLHFGIPILIGNFIIDSVVIWLILSFLDLQKNRGLIWKKSIVRVFLFGFLSDILGSLCGILCTYGLLSIDTCTPQWLNGIFRFMKDWMAIFAIFIAALCIYGLNKKFSFSKCQDLLSPKQIQILCVGLAILTAPYIMLIL